MFVEFRAGDELPAVLSEVFENGVFARGERDRLAGFRDRLGARVEPDVLDFKFGMGVACGAADQGAQACQKFREVEWFYQVIVRASVEAFDAILARVAR